MKQSASSLGSVLSTGNELWFHISLNIDVLPENLKPVDCSLSFSKFTINARMFRAPKYHSYAETCTPQNIHDSRYFKGLEVFYRMARSIRISYTMKTNPALNNVTE
jgi:hypothetical protein